MGVFAIIASNDKVVADRIADKIQPKDFYRADGHVWFVCAPTEVVTTKELSDFLNISSGAAGRVIVMHVTSYYGYHERELWDWLQIKGS
ncbi:hypothetical protein AB0327_003133 [Salmonella enterica]|uniref:hypothetical protein n=1 Tax=Salmonella enterica TaxID=28901 RepID=UPI001077EBFB|nr:hypothetical protein [Salmonella enterica]EAA8358369.1 hypothetical protein [Salmonella enterica subsp. enterica serovar Poona]ECC3903343.1 hypothetical protein [Salmonella enterica subsp. enterica]EDV0941175.1 hypothetical protein [Salmonella enterica subsp. enterica serovar Pomona]EED8614632.1 hypothetical protein [Salmonella enterica subsp. enterica serovar Glostrup]EAM4476173.1 hypothetical protein [Salmonella enterica subsp. enterica serovar Give]